MEVVDISVWQHYTKSGDKSTGTCKICRKVIKTKFGNTSGLLRHLYQHPAIKKEFYDLQKKKSLQPRASSVSGEPVPKQLKIEDTFKWSPTHVKATAITNSIGEWLADAMLPYNTVENMSFIKLLGTAQPLYRVPSRTTFSRTVVPGLYLKVRENVSKQVEDALASVASMSFTCDLWTSPANDAFMAVTCHFIKDFTLKTFCLGCHHFPGGHTGAAIADRFTSVLQEWNIVKLKDTIPLYVVTDNGRNIKLGMSMCCVELVQLQCFAHTLQLALNDALKETDGMGSMLKRARTIVGHYKHSSSATEKLHKIQTELGLPPLSLIQDCATRWNSEYLMLSRLLENKEALACNLATQNIDNLTVSEWQLVEAYVKILKPLYEATTELCTEQSPSASMVIPVLFSVTQYLTGYVNKNKGIMGVGVVFARALLQSLKARFPLFERSEPYYTAMLVDPRFKHVVVPKDEKMMAVEHLKRKVELISPSQTNTPDKPEAQEKKSSLWKVFDEMAQQAENNGNMEVTDYLSLPTIPRADDPLKWWKEKGSSLYPQLCKIAIQYLGIPATEAASERVFSGAGNIVSYRRQLLATEHVQELVFLHENKKRL